MLLTRELRFRLRANAEQSYHRCRDHFPVVKLFKPDVYAKWLITELMSDGDTLYGLCDLGVGCPELGCASLAELSAVRGHHGLLVERDQHFHPTKPLSAYADEARLARRIVA